MCTDLRCVLWLLCTVAWAAGYGRLEKWEDKVSPHGLYSRDRSNLKRIGQRVSSFKFGKGSHCCVFVVGEGFLEEAGFPGALKNSMPVPSSSLSSLSYVPWAAEMKAEAGVSVP